MEFQLLFCVERFFRSKLIVKLLGNQEREQAGLDQEESHDTSSAIQVGVEAVRLLIAQDLAK